MRRKTFRKSNVVEARQKQKRKIRIILIYGRADDRERRKIIKLYTEINSHND